MGNTVEFTLYEKDAPLNIQLEPECFNFKVLSGQTIRFVQKTNDKKFRWAIRVCDEASRWIQLFPEGESSYRNLEVYVNGELLADWDFTK